MIEEREVFPMMKHTELINYVARKIKAEAYLEIGVYNKEHNFDRINVVYKKGIDPDPAANADFEMTSDDYFDLTNSTRFDLIFIDGLHHADQVRKVIINS